MAKRKFNLQTRNSRRSIPVGTKLHVSPLIERLALGYRKGVRGGSWFARRHEGGTKYSFEPLGIADDIADADGIEVLTYDQAKAKAEAWFKRKKEEEAGGVVIDENLTVSQLMEQYIKDREIRKRRPQYTSKTIARGHILPRLGALKVSELNHSLLKRWLDELAVAQPRKRKAEIDKNDAETLRKRQKSANRIFCCLLAALNWGFREGIIGSRSAWERIQLFGNVDAARVYFLSDDEVTPFLDNCPDDFRTLAQADLLTGCRYSELSRLKASDFSAELGNIYIRQTKSGKPRYVELTPAANAWFKHWTAGKRADDLVFLRSNGQPWKKCDQTRPMLAACQAAGIPKEKAWFHVLRHTYASHARMKGMPIGVLAKQLGHETEKITEKHYGHIGDDHLKQQVAFHGPTFGIASPPDAPSSPHKVIPIARDRKRA